MRPQDGRHPRSAAINRHLHDVLCAVLVQAEIVRERGRGGATQIDPALDRALSQRPALMGVNEYGL